MPFRSLQTHTHTYTYKVRPKSSVNGQIFEERRGLET